MTYRTPLKLLSQIIDSSRYIHAQDTADVKFTSTAGGSKSVLVEVWFSFYNMQDSPLSRYLVALPQGVTEALGGNCRRYLGSLAACFEEAWRVWPSVCLALVLFCFIFF